MAGRRKVRDSALVDFLATIPQRPFQGEAWRIVRNDRDPLRGSMPKGRWDDGTFEVLYTSLEADGAMAEMHFHVMRGQPVFPSQMQFRLYELDVSPARAVTFAGIASLGPAGIDAATYGGLGYSRRDEEYSASQLLGETAHFLDADALVVPNARWDCLNAVLFTERIPAGHVSVKRDHGIVDWAAWKT